MMTFLNPLLLIGALGVAVPILAHLINRQQVQRTDWAAMQFLNRSVRVRSQQIRLRDILLLLMRCTALLLLVFALSRPATTSDGAYWLPGEERAGVVIAIDGSFSMAHRDGDVSRFERALEQVGVIRQRITQGAPVTLVLLGGEHRVLLRNVAYAPERFEKLLLELQPTPRRLICPEVTGSPAFQVTACQSACHAAPSLYCFSPTMPYPGQLLSEAGYT